MSYENRQNKHSKILYVSGEPYLWQGDDTGDDTELLMIRRLDQLLECERDNVQRIMGEKLK